MDKPKPKYIFLFLSRCRCDQEEYMVIAHNKKEAKDLCRKDGADNDYFNYYTKTLKFPIKNPEKYECKLLNPVLSDDGLWDK